MRPSSLVFTAFLAASATVVACKHDDGMATDATTIHSGTLPGPRVTDAPLEERAAPEYGPAAVRAELGDRLAHAYCSHDRACALGDAEMLLLSEDVCFNDARMGYRASIDAWPCRPSQAKAGFDECVAAIREAACSARSGEGAQIRACQASEICRRSNIAGQ